MKTPDAFVHAIRDELHRDRAERPHAPTPRSEPIIELRDVWLSFDSEPVLRGVDLHVHKGENLVVVGESGCGKSTLLKLILRLLVPDHGEIRIFGREINHISFDEARAIRRRIGMVFQNAALFDSLSIYDNVAYPLRENTDLDEARIQRKVRQCLDFVDLDPEIVMPRLPAELSGGMRKRVGIARAIASDPEIVLYDEPTAGLDPLAVATINRLIRKLQAGLGVASVIVTHDIRAGFRVATRVNLLRDGKIRFDGTPEEMVATEDPYIRAFLS